MAKLFTQVQWDAPLSDDCRRLIRMAMQEDLHDRGDLTSLALVPEDQHCRAAVVCREEMVLAGLPAGQLVLTEYDADARLVAKAADGDIVGAGTVIAEIEGSARTLLAAERVLLNFIGRLSGIATQTNQFVQAVTNSHAQVYDTRKTTPGWRQLEKYAVGRGGGMNHRGGLYEAVLIKDNHIAYGRTAAKSLSFGLAEAIEHTRQFVQNFNTATIIEIEVDNLAQLQEVLPARPDIILLDNMSPDTLREAVSFRDEICAEVQLEASGGITIGNISEIAASGVDRISTGALTHSARWRDVGLDWLD